MGLLPWSSRCRVHLSRPTTTTTSAPEAANDVYHRGEGGGGRVKEQHCEPVWQPEVVVGHCDAAAAAVQEVKAGEAERHLGDAHAVGTRGNSGGGIHPLY